MRFVTLIFRLLHWALALVGMCHLALGGTCLEGCVIRHVRRSKPEAAGHAAT